MRIRIKLGAASLAFVPMMLFFFVPGLVDNGYLAKAVGHYILMVCGWFNFPAFSALTLVRSYQVSQAGESLFLVVTMFLWSSFLAWIFWQIAREFLGENEPEFDTNPEGAKYDWAGFRVRFVCGFIIGFLTGWRIVRSSTNTGVLLTAMIMAGFVAGLGFGLYRPNFWSRW